MLPGDLANTNTGLKGQRHHFPAERIIVRTPPLSHNLDPLHWSSHSGCLTSVIRHDPKLDVTHRATQGAEIGRLLSPALVQPISSDDVADAMAEAALGASVNGMIEIAGPERLKLSALIACSLDAGRDSRRMVRTLSG